jgi:hypothetical protein
MTKTGHPRAQTLSSYCSNPHTLSTPVSSGVKDGLVCGFAYDLESEGVAGAVKGLVHCVEHAHTCTVALIKLRTRPVSEKGGTSRGERMYETIKAALTRPGRLYGLSVVTSAVGCWLVLQEYSLGIISESICCW